MTDTLFRVPAAALLALAPCVSTEETRYYLTGVCIEPSGWMAATDGHVLGAVHAGAGRIAPARPLILRLPKPALAMLKACAKPREPLWVSGARENGDQIRLTPCNVDGVPWPAIPPAFGAEIDGTFPDWRRVIPRDGAALASAPCAAFNPESIARLMGVVAYSAGAYPGARDAPKMADIRGPADGPCILLPGDAQPTIAVIMPVRGVRTVDAYAAAARAAGVAFSEAE